MPLRFPLFLAAALLFSQGHATELRYRVDMLPASLLGASLAGFNDSGAIVGTTTWTDPMGQTYERAFVYGNGAVDMLHDPSGPYRHTVGTAINDRGDVVGNNGTQALYWPAGGEPRHLPAYGIGFARANAVNDSRQIAGAADFGNAGTQAALWNGVSGPRNLGTLGGVYSTAYAINASGAVAGSAENAGGLDRPFLHTEAGGMQDIGGALEGEGAALAINDSGTVVGNMRSASGYRAFIHDNGVTSLLPLAPGASGNSVGDINNLGWVVGSSVWTGSGPTPEHKAYLYIGGDMVELGTLVDPGWTVHGAQAINDAGQIVASVCGAGGCGHALLTPIPEPAAWLLFGAGLMALAALVRARRGERA